MKSIKDIANSYSNLNSVEKRKAIFSYVQNLPYQINWLSKPEQVMEAWAWYCVSKHRLLKEIYKEIWIESDLCYVPFSFWKVYLPENLQYRWIATKNWYHVFLQCTIESQKIYVDASFPMAFTRVFQTTLDRDWTHSMIPFWWPYENIIVCKTKEQEKIAKHQFTKNTELDAKDKKRVEEFNNWSLTVWNKEEKEYCDI